MFERSEFRSTQKTSLAFYVKILSAQSLLPTFRRHEKLEKNNNERLNLANKLLKGRRNLELKLFFHNFAS